MLRSSTPQKHLAWHSSQIEHTLGCNLAAGCSRNIVGLCNLHSPRIDWRRTRSIVHWHHTSRGTGHPPRYCSFWRIAQSPHHSQACSCRQQAAAAREPQLGAPESAGLLLVWLRTFSSSRSCFYLYANIKTPAHASAPAATPMPMPKDSSAAEVGDSEGGSVLCVWVSKKTF